MLLAVKSRSGGEQLQKGVLQNFLRVRHVVQIAVRTAQNGIAIGVQGFRRHLVGSAAYLYFRLQQQAGGKADKFSECLP